jgi:hypothetical protein
MGYVVCVLITATISYAFGYIARGWVDADKRRAYRKQMGLPDISEECKDCLNLGLDCDPNCQYNVTRKENHNGKSEKNNNQKN